MSINDIVDQASYLEMAKALIDEWGRPLVFAEMEPEAKVFRKTQYNWAWGVLDANRGKPRPRIAAHKEYLVGFDGGPPPRKEDGEIEATSQREGTRKNSRSTKVHSKPVRRPRRR